MVHYKREREGEGGKGNDNSYEEGVLLFSFLDSNSKPCMCGGGVCVWRVVCVSVCVCVCGGGVVEGVMVMQSIDLEANDAARNV